MHDASDPLATLARLLVAPAAFPCSTPAGALLVAVAATITGPDLAAALRLPNAGGRERRIVVQCGQMVEFGGLSVAQILRITGALPVEAGTVGCCRGPELAALLAEGAAGGLFIEGAPGPELVGMAEFVWACRCAGVPSVVVPANAPLAALDAGADLVVVDVAQAYGGQELGLIVGRAEAQAACAIQQPGLGALFRASDEALAAAVVAVRATAVDLAAGRAVPAW